MLIYISGVWNVEVWSGHAQLLRTIHLIVLLEYITGMKLAGITELYTIPLSVQQILHLNVFPIMFYESLNVQNRMCELCMFSQIRSHI